MTLQKRFLHEPNPLKGIHKFRYWAGIVIAIFFAISLYSLMITVREMFRVVSITETHDIWVISDGALRFNNTIFAFISVIISQSFLLGFWFDRPRKPRSKRGFRYKMIVNDQRNLNWVFLFWFAKLGMVTYALIVPAYFFMSKAVNFYPEFNYAFILVIIVLFLHPWMGITRIYKKVAFKWMGVSAIALTILAFGLSFFSPIDNKAITEKAHKKNFRKNYILDLPILDKHSSMFTRDISYDLFIGLNPKDSSLVIGFQDTVIPFDSNAYQLRKLLTSHFEEEPYNLWRGRYYCKLFLHKDICMSVLNNIRYTLYLHHSRSIFYACEPSTYNSDYHKFFMHSLGIYNPMRHGKVINFGEVPPPPPPPEPNPTTKEDYLNLGLQCIDVDFLENNLVQIQTDTVSIDHAFEYFHSNYSHSTQLFINLDYTNNTTYNDYLRLVFSFNKFIHQQRDEYCMAKYQMNYEEIRYSDLIDQKEVSHMFTFIILE